MKIKRLLSRLPFRLKNSTPIYINILRAQQKTIKHPINLHPVKLCSMRRRMHCNYCLLGSTQTLNLIYITALTFPSHSNL